MNREQLFRHVIWPANTLPAWRTMYFDVRKALAGQDSWPEILDQLASEYKTQTIHHKAFARNTEMENAIKADLDAAATKGEPK